MAEMIRKVEYYYTTAANKPGEGTRLLDALRMAGVNLRAVHGFPSARKAQIDFVPADTAAFLAADEGLEVTLVEADPRLGGTCLLRGCIPSKALLHVARVIAEVDELRHDWGVEYPPPKLDVNKIRERKEKEREFEKNQRTAPPPEQPLTP